MGYFEAETLLNDDDRRAVDASRAEGTRMWQEGLKKSSDTRKTAECSRRNLLRGRARMAAMRSMGINGACPPELKAEFMAEVGCVALPHLASRRRRRS